VVLHLHIPFAPVIVQVPDSVGFKDTGITQTGTAYFKRSPGADLRHFFDRDPFFLVPDQEKRLDIAALIVEADDIDIFPDHNLLLSLMV
jgi:hypothetical protein